MMQNAWEDKNLNVFCSPEDCKISYTEGNN